MIDFNEALSQEEMHDIAKEQFILALRGHFANEENFKRILSNLSYNMVWDKVDEVAGSTIEEYLPEKVQSIINDLSIFNIFKKPDAWSRETNNGYQILEECLRENKPLIASKTVEAINSAPKKYLRELSEEAFKTIIERAITGK